ncbi:MAG: hypothetical protein A3F31_02050 [Candidatus Levybacteria bacterium RIFCSPHIGHO2_12_FULL_38_12]|nr:MAG: hypothetical protein A2770_04005 [Candidatus Levybacteria bacterium RIFCSPHIGHO2_01_FULL_38_12]OGH22243.1 MAG: hypothetical protein A3F31_02050 [Candidatus Levybacteria bacterium RIFCSPHIGHO2_12_FULL_38_12]OGH43889.1 MAG: hypothetical protein A3J14_04720 [Candidatus Levybacteria bacterium RIFCSPLOWO2_02_FULL_37_18]
MKKELQLESCLWEAVSENPPGTITAADLRIVVSGKPYLLSVATTQHVEEVKQVLQKDFAHEALPDNAFFIVDQKDLASQEELCRKIAQTPLNQIQPFLTELPKD